MKKDFENKVVIVTGAAAGIGKAIARRIASGGAKVLLVDYNEAKLNEALEGIKKDFGGSAAVFAADLTKAAQFATKIVAYAKETFGKIDILVNCAGIYPSKMALEITEEDWDMVLDLNTKGYFFMAQAVAKSMVEDGTKGQILNITSTASEIARPGVVHYCSSKAAAKMMTQVLALEWSKYGIRVNALGPGLIETDTLLATLTTEKAIKEHEEKISMCPLGRIGKPEEMAEIAAFFLSDAADFITGQTLLADGGYGAGRSYQSMK